MQVVVLAAHKGTYLYEALVIIFPYKKGAIMLGCNFNTRLCDIWCKNFCSTYKFFCVQVLL